MTRRTILGIAIVAALVLVPLVGMSDYDVQYYLMASYAIDGNCTGNSLPLYQMLADYREEMADKNWEKSQYFRVGHDALCDPDVQAGGHDYDYVDDGDISIIGGHDSHSSAIATQWVYELFESDEFYYPDEGQWVDNCPVAYTGRNSLADCTTILGGERYPTPGNINIIAQDVSSPTNFKRKFLDNCDPAAGDPM
jgi:hypothetical protein